MHALKLLLGGCELYSKGTHSKSITQITYLFCIPCSRLSAVVQYHHVRIHTERCDRPSAVSALGEPHFKQTYTIQLEHTCKLGLDSLCLI